MSDILLIHDATLRCQDAVTREGGSIVLRDGKYVFLDANGVPLEGERRAVGLEHGIIPMHPGAFSMHTEKAGPIFD